MNKQQINGLSDFEALELMMKLTNRDFQDDDVNTMMENIDDAIGIAYAAQRDIENDDSYIISSTIDNDEHRTPKYAGDV